MPQITVKAEIPEGFELACDHLRSAGPGDSYVTNEGLLTPPLWSRAHTSGKYIIVRPVWQWPAWLTARWLFRRHNAWWFASDSRPEWVSGYCVDGDGVCRQIHDDVIDFTPPPCEDDRSSLRENPNWKES